MNEDEPEFKDELPECPDHLHPIAKKEWDRVVGELHETRVLKSVHMATLAAYCDQYSVWVRANELININLFTKTKSNNGAVAQNPALPIARKALSLMLSFQSELGITPASATKIKVEKAERLDPMEALRKRRKK